MRPNEAARKGILCVVLCGAGISGPFLAYLLDYLRGQDIWLVPIPILFPFVLLALEWLLPFVIGACLVVVAIAWYRRRPPLLVVLVMLGMTMLWLPHKSRSYRIATDPFLLGYLVKARRESDIPQLQRWAAEQIRADRPELSPTSMPRGAPQGFRFVGVVRQGELRGPHVKLSTGGHFVGFWGLRVGAATLRCGSPPREYQLAPGVCAWWQDESEFGLDN